jgi:hypothetical protein
MEFLIVGGIPFSFRLFNERIDDFLEQSWLKSDFHEKNPQRLGGTTKKHCVRRPMDDVVMRAGLTWPRGISYDPNDRQKYTGRLLANQGPDGQEKTL